MAARHRTLTEYVQAQEMWSEYIEQIKQYFIANNMRRGSKERAFWSQ
jgi:hypothetical protein